jgi:hypothetical protein
MTKMSKIFLVISMTTFLANFTAAGNDFAWGILKPVSAISFILFFITNVLAKEVALFDEEQRRIRMDLQAQNLVPPASKPSASQEQHAQVFVSAGARN